jgi:transposase
MRRLSLNGSEPVEETGDAMAVVRVLSPFVARVIIANPLQVKASGHVKTDKIDAGVLRALAREFPERRLVGRDGPSPSDALWIQ